MAKKKKRKHASRPAPRSTYRNATPSGAGKAKQETPLARIGYTVAGAGAAALAVTMFEHEKWEPKKVAGVLGLGGAALAWRSSNEAAKAIGLGVSSAAGAQLALLVMSDHEKKLADAAASNSSAQSDAATVAQTSTPAQNSLPASTTQRPANAGQALPPGALESALARAQARLALAEGDGT
ncbi:MAG TPA: hypothetical protein VH143_06580 [Kofleriaceae bacterium]|jgi:hypothetical protein|nr:hypothetical protein [Kofleriaceae bacterium]